MDQEIKKKWVEALRSGKYEQGKHYLKRENKFSVLGVLCDISGIGEWEITSKNEKVQEKYMKSFTILPDKICDEFEMSPNPYFYDFDIEEFFEPERLNELKQNGLKCYGECYFLSDINDCGATFNELADLIEKYL